MKLSTKMQEKEQFMKSIGWQSFEWTTLHILMARNGAACKIDKSGKVRYLRQDEIDAIKETIA